MATSVETSSCGRCRTSRPTTFEELGKGFGMVGRLRFFPCGVQPAWVSGAPETCHVLKVMTKTLTEDEGLNTASYPIEVLFPGVLAGEPIRDGSVGVSVGAATAVAAKYLVYQEALGNLLDPESAEMPWPERFHYAKALWTCLHLHVRYNPAADVQTEAFRSIKTKNAAANRSRPNPLQLLHAFDRLVRDVRTSTGTRKDYVEVLAAEINKYNKGVIVKAEGIYPEEAQVMKLLATWDEESRRLIKAIWALDRLQYTSMPLIMLALSFLKNDAQLAVTQKDNPKWFAILTPTPAKLVAWILRTEGRFQAKVPPKKHALT